jgi:hypothetical protein
MAVASQLGLLPLFLTNFAAVFAPLSALGDLTGAGRMRAFLGVGHLTPPGAGAILPAVYRGEDDENDFLFLRS